jgi:threonyl-tRNA synthetase
MGSIERFFAILVEHYAGKFPVWLAPVQARVVTISEKQNGWAASVRDRLATAGMRVEADLSGDKLGAKIRRAQLEKIPYMLVIGDNEVEAAQVAPRSRDGEQLEAMSIEGFLAHIAPQLEPPAV